MKPTAAASRVAAARAAAKAAKPPPTRKTSEAKSSPTRNPSEGMSSPVRKPSVSPAKEITEAKEEHGVEHNAEDVAIENGVFPVPDKEGGNHETEAVSLDSAVQEGVSQNGDKIVEVGGEVLVDGEGGDIGTSEC